jgi:hypothetical protein
MAVAQRLSARRCARALWLLGLADPKDVDEVRSAWKVRVAQAHPDRRGDHPDAAHRLTAAFNDARDVCERWAATGQPWPRPSRGLQRVELWTGDEDDADDRPEPAPRRSPSPDEARGERLCGLRPGDLVRELDAHGLPHGRVLEVRRVTATGESPVVELADGREQPASSLGLACFGCPVCGACEGPLRERMRRRPCLACLRDLQRLERERGAADAIADAVAMRARAGRVHADDLGDHALGELARERIRWCGALRRRPRHERSDALLAAFAHGFAVWGDAPLPEQQPVWGRPQPV